MSDRLTPDPKPRTLSERLACVLFGLCCAMALVLLAPGEWRGIAIGVSPMAVLFAAGTWSLLEDQVREKRRHS